MTHAWRVTWGGVYAPVPADAQIVVSLLTDWEARQEGARAVVYPAGAFCRRYGAPDTAAAADVVGLLERLVHIAEARGATRFHFHCWDGVSRSVAAAVAMRVFLGQPPAEAIAAVRAEGGAHPNPHMIQAVHRLAAAR